VKAIHYITTNGIGNAWVANELSRVQTRDVPVVLHAMRRPDKLLHASEWAVKMDERTKVIYPLPILGTVASVLRALLVFRGRFFAAFCNALFGVREHLRARIAGIGHFFVACHWVHQVGACPEEVSHIHAQWIHSSGTIAMYGAWLLGVPYSFTGHAADLFRERCALKDKIRRAEFIVCISDFHRRFYLENGAQPKQLMIAYCGIDMSWFYPPENRQAPERPFRIVSSGRLVEKKGFPDLIEACRILAKRGEKFECIIGGSGELEAELRSLAERAGVADIVVVTGRALIQEKIVEFMHGGDVYVLPCVWARDGDIDGLPQMLMEAMASGLPAISTRLVGIPDLIRHEESGLLVEPRCPVELADAIQRLMHDRPLAARLAAAGRKRVAEQFDLSTCLEPLIERYRRCLGLDASGASMETPTAESVASPRRQENVVA
jgi:glycosyltransferase involved in cell wall biosynthesis